MLLETLSHILPVLEGNMGARLPGISSFKTGARFVQDNSGGNRVVWVPLRDSFEPGRQQPGVRRVTRTRVARTLAYLWGVPTKLDGTIYKRGEAVDPTQGRNSLGQVEALLNALLCALEDSCKSVQYDVEDGGEWSDQDGESVSDYGLGYSLTFTIRIPVVYDPLVLTAVADESIGYLNPDTSITTPPP